MRANLALAEDLPSIPADTGWSTAMLLWAEVYTVLRDRDGAGALYELLEPFSGQVVVSGPMVYGAIDWALGTLANTMERHEDAERHVVASAEIDVRLGAPLFLARTRVGHARTLIACRKTDDLDSARQMPRAGRGHRGAARRGADHPRSRGVPRRALGDKQVAGTTDSVLPVCASCRTRPRRL